LSKSRSFLNPYHDFPAFRGNWEISIKTLFSPPFFPFLEMFLIRSIKIIFIVLLDLPADLPANSKERKNQ